MVWSTRNNPIALFHLCIMYSTSIEGLHDTGNTTSGDLQSCGDGVAVLSASSPAECAPHVLHPKDSLKKTISFGILRFDYLPALMMRSFFPFIWKVKTKTKFASQFLCRSNRNLNCGIADQDRLLLLFDLLIVLLSHFRSSGKLLFLATAPYLWSLILNEMTKFVLRSFSCNT